jgi:hypothetical protein
MCKMLAMKDFLFKKSSQILCIERA